MTGTGSMSKVGTGTSTGQDTKLERDRVRDRNCYRDDDIDINNSRG